LSRGNERESEKKLNRYLGDNSIVFENFTASIGDLMVANIRLLATRLEESVNGYLRPSNRKLMP
jgi:hypothetical protein